MSGHPVTPSGRVSSLATPQLKEALYRVARFTLSHGAYPHFEQLALALTSRLYQALNLTPEPLSHALLTEALEGTEAQRMLMSVELASRLAPWLSSRFEEAQLADLLQGVMWAMSASEGRLHALLTALNLEVLAPLKVKLNPRKWIEAEERMGSALYRACLLTPPESDTPSLPRHRWPQLSDYELLISLPMESGVSAFFAVRLQDQLRCWVYLSEELEVRPALSGPWPAQYVAPLERGVWGGLQWVSVPSVSPISLRDLTPYLDTYCALNAAEQSLEVLAALHQQGAAHLDLNPEHLRIDHRLLVRAQPHLSARSGERLWAGAGALPHGRWPLYVSPEQRAGLQGDARSDLWSLGALLYELFEGRSLVNVSSWARLPEALVASAEAALKEECEHLPEPLRELVARCVCDEPDERWSDARLVLEAFRPLAQELRAELKSQGRSAQWARLIGEGHLMRFVEREVEAISRAREDELAPLPPPERVADRLLVHLAERELSLSSAEDPTQLLQDLVQQARELQDGLDEWREMSREARAARQTLIEHIAQHPPEETFEALERLVEEKKIALEALSAATARVDELNELKPLRFYERLQLFIDQEELEVSLERLVGVHVESARPSSRAPAPLPAPSATPAPPLLTPALSLSPQGSLRVPSSASPQVTPPLPSMWSLEPAELSAPPERVEGERFEGDRFEGDRFEGEVSEAPREVAVWTEEGFPSAAWVPPHSAHPPQQLFEEQLEGEGVPDFEDLSAIDAPRPEAQSVIEVSGVEFDELSGFEELEGSDSAQRDPFEAPHHPQRLTLEASLPINEVITAERELSLSGESPLDEAPLFDEVEPSALIAQELEEEPEEGSEEELHSTGEMRTPEGARTAQELKQLRALYERFLSLKIEYGEPIDDLSFELFLEEINHASELYVERFGARSFKLSVQYKRGRVAIKARPLKDA